MATIDKAPLLTKLGGMIGRLLNADFEQRLEERFDRLERLIERVDQRASQRIDQLFVEMGRIKEDLAELKMSQKRLPQLEHRIFRIEDRLMLGEDPPA